MEETSKKLNDCPEAILTEVWNFLSSKPMPKIVLRRQRSTGKSFRSERLISIREDSWNKMHLAEKRLIVIHEAIHQCKVPHMPGFRTSTDMLSLAVYRQIWGEDSILKEFFQGLNAQAAKIIEKNR